MITWSLKRFNELAPEEVYCALQLRNEVFVVEQNCVFQDADNKDQQSWHLMGWSGHALVAYSRIIPAGVAYDSFPSIGRVVTSQKVRRTGIGRELMQQSIDSANKLFGNRSIKLGGQLYLKKFYESFDFTQSSDVYLEDGIEHIEMIRTA